MSIKMLNDDSPHSIGIRLQRLRMMAGLEQSALAEAAAVSKTSISYWETGRSNIKSDNMWKLIKVIRQHGVEFDEHWLTRGIGITPRLTFLMGEPGTSYTPQTPVEQIAAFESELKLFLTYHPEAIIVKIENDNFAPCLQKGDYIAGEWQEAVKVTAPTLGIVEEEGKWLVRHVVPTVASSQFYLYSAFMEPSSLLPEIRELERIAVLARIWR